MKRNYSLIMKSSLLVGLGCICSVLSARGATMSISSNPGQDVTVKLDLPANNTEGVAVSCSFTFQTAKGLLGPRSLRSHSTTGDESCVCIFLSHFGQRQRSLGERRECARREATLAAMERRRGRVFARRDDSRAKGTASDDRFCARAFSEPYVLGQR